MPTRDENLGLFTDLYEIRMVETYLRLGMTAPATFSLFARPSKARPAMVACGLGRALDVLDAFRFGAEDIAFLRTIDVPEPVARWLAGMTITGELWAVPEGTVVLGHEPILELTAPLPIAQLLETAVMNAMHFDTLIATKAARCVRAARGRSVVDFGCRRAHGFEAGLRAAYASYVGGAEATSNLRAGQRWGIPVRGTMAHAFVQAFERERDAFRAFALDHPEGTTLLVETYDPVRGLQNAVAIAEEMAERGQSLEGVRIDSEPLGELAQLARRMFDEAGLDDVKIVLSGGLDEERVDALVSSGAPADGFGIGSALVVSSDKPALDIAYKLVDYDGRARAKYSEDKATYPGRKQIFRSGHPSTDVLEHREADAPGEPLLELVYADGERLVEPDLMTSRERAIAEVARLDDAWLLPGRLDELVAPAIGPALEALAERVRERLMTSAQA